MITHTSINNYVVPDNAILAERKISIADATVENEWLKSTLNPYESDDIQYQYKKVDLTFDLQCKSANEIEQLKSRLRKEFTKGTIKFTDIDFYYTGIADSVDFEPTVSIPGMYEGDFSVSFFAIAEGEQKSETISSSKIINVLGDNVTPCIVEINPTVGLANVVLSGLADESITVKNLTTNKKVILDGEKCLVTQDGRNKFPDCDFWQFPRLQPGENKITISQSSCNVTIKYKPRYL